MPIFIESRPAPNCWAEHQAAPLPATDIMCGPRSCGIRIAFVNNMPDAALEDTELQFFNLLDAAAGDIPIRIRLYSLPGIGRSERLRAGSEDRSGSRGVSERTGDARRRVELGCAEGGAVGDARGCGPRDRRSSGEDIDMRGD